MGPAGSPQEAGRAVAWAEEMRRVHRRLHDALDVAREAVETPDRREGAPDAATSAAMAGDLLLHCWGFCLALTGHHGGEDAILFPRLRAARPELGDVLDALTRDHAMLEHLVTGLDATLRRPATREERLRHLDGLEAAMTTHFRWEERSLLPVLAELDDDAPPSAVFGPLA